MAKHMVCKWAICPHYRHEDAQVIYCDGQVDDAVIHLAFATRSEALAYKKDLCRGNYRACKIYQMLEGKE